MYDGDSDFDEGLSNLGGYEADDPACGGGGRAGGCIYSFETELGHLNGKVQKLEDLIRLLIADSGLAGWEETQRVENLRRKITLEREVAERDHVRRVEVQRVRGRRKRTLRRMISRRGG